ncbi:APC family permease [Sediminibacillus albus]|uniref:Amino acid efflux transporter n=1 Tax=Sediminibacillus albus TaxID=407036 RepID=A0A1G8YD28_9BACI|nr:amino acid permease [Sediminibacillus albus]SDK00631.1 amino acid efflux transporter [Sediminibacillus albus]
MTNRTITISQGISLYIAAILGSGVLFVSGITASMAGPASIVSWAIVILFSFPLAYSFASLARDFPDAGGTATFVRKSFGYHLGNIVGWFYFVTAAVGQTIVALTGAFYLSRAFDFGLFGEVLAAVILLLVAGSFNYFGMEVSGKAALIISTSLLILLIITIIVALPNVSLLNFQPFFSEGWYSIGSAITVIFWAFFGWEAICNLSSSFTEPHKNIVKSSMISAVIIGILFLFLSFVTIGTGTYGNAESDFSPVAIIIQDTLGIGAKVITAILAYLICIGTSNAFIASLTQLGYSLSRDKAFPRLLSKIHPSGVPRRMVIFSVGFAISGIIITVALSTTFNDLLFIPTSLGLIVYALTMLSGIKLFKLKSKPWICSLISFVFILCVIPFFEVYLLVPLAVLAFYFIYMLIVKQS